MENQNVTAIRTGEAENQIVTIEELLIKLALAEMVINEMGRYVEAVEANDGMRPDDMTPPDHWALAGVSRNMFDIGRALKCACWGHETAHLC